jgi:hypothetical protein
MQASERALKFLAQYAAGERAFEGIDLSGENLWAADLRGARFAQANFRSAILNGARLSGSDLRDADFTGANLAWAELRNARLMRARLSGTDLRGANLTNAKLSGADLEDAFIGETLLLGVSLAPFCRANLRYFTHCIVDDEAIVLSVAEPRLKDFLRRVGVPDVFVEYRVDCARSLRPDQLFSLFQKTFLSYGGPDGAFARKLNDALERAGVPTFFFADDATPGEKLHRVMRQAINDHDRVIVVCSQASLVRSGVLNEIEETLQREARDGGNAYLIPVRLDDYVMGDWGPPGREDLAVTLRDRVIGEESAAAQPAGRAGTEEGSHTRPGPPLSARSTYFRSYASTALSTKRGTTTRLRLVSKPMSAAPPRLERTGSNLAFGLPL